MHHGTSIKSTISTSHQTHECENTPNSAHKTHTSGGNSSTFLRIGLDHGFRVMFRYGSVCLRKNYTVK